MYCFEYNYYPCEKLSRLDNRYKNSYGMNIIDNLDFIRDSG